MSWKLPTLRLNVSTMALLVALSAILIWAGLSFFSPTRGLTRQIQPDQPTYLRREAVGALGYVPSWEADQAIDVLLVALNDPSPRVRENALGAIAAHGHRAARAIPSILKWTGDPDRYVRYIVYGALGQVTPLENARPNHAIVMAALQKGLKDPDPQNALRAAASLLQLHQTDAAIPTISSTATDPSNPYLHSHAREYIRQYGTNADLIAGVIPLLTAPSQPQRQLALEILTELAPASTVTEALQDAQESKNEEVHWWAAGKLSALTPRGTAEPHATTR